MSIEFNEDGSIKLPENLEKQKKELHNKLESDKIILFKRNQVSTETPAIAHLEIKIPQSFDEPRKILDYCAKRVSESKMSSENQGFNLDFKRIDDHNCYIEVKSHWKMYTWLESFIENFQKHFKGVKIMVVGHWDKFDSNFV